MRKATLNGVYFSISSTGMRIKNNVCGAASSSLEISDVIVHFCVLLKKESMCAHTHMNIYVVSMCPMNMILSSLLQIYFSLQAFIHLLLNLHCI